MSARRPWRRDAGGLTLFVRLTPRGGRDRIEGVRLDADGRPTLSARVAAPPAEGAANAALTALLAKALGAPRGAVRIERGAQARVKQVAVEGDPDALEAALARLVG